MTKFEKQILAGLVALFVLGLGLRAWKTNRSRVDWQAQTVEAAEFALPQSSSADLVPTNSPLALVNLNHANLSDLETLPHVGPVLAQRILDFRSEQGQFRTKEDLLKVKGIGRKLYEKLEPRVTVDFR